MFLPKQQQTPRPSPASGSAEAPRSMQMLSARANLSRAPGESAFGYPFVPFASKKKSDENGGAGLPEGVQRFSPALPNGAATGTAVDISTVEKPQQPDWDNGFDEETAKRFSAQRHSSLAELGTNLAIDITKDDRRMRRLIVGGHGNRDVLATGSGDGPDMSDALNLKASNKDTWLPYFSRDRFYGRAEIWVFSCNVGNGPIPQLIADQSGSTVYAYTRTAYSTEETPWAKP